MESISLSLLQKASKRLVQRQWILEPPDKLYINISDKTCCLIKQIPKFASVFSGHFPTRPLYPGVLLLELQFQTAVVYWEACQRQSSDQTKLDVPFLTSARFRKLVLPGDTITVTVQQVSHVQENNLPWTLKGIVTKNSLVLAESVFQLQNETSSVSSIDKKSHQVFDSTRVNR
eukprot:jgi/Galph1/5671/GphlegSOOS_G4398.1